MTNLVKEEDKVKIFIPDGENRICTPIKICKPGFNLFSNEGLEVTALWDTGAQSSAITANIAGWLRLELEEGGWSIGAFKKVRTKRAVALAFQGNSDWYTMVRPSVFPKMQKGIDFIIGMDIIMSGDFLLRKTDEGSLLEFVFNPEYFINIKKDTVAEASRKRKAMEAKLERLRIKNMVDEM